MLTMDDILHLLRKMSTEDKRKLGTALTRLSPEDLTKALEIVAENNPSFQATAEEVDLDMDAQVENTFSICFPHFSGHLHHLFHTSLTIVSLQKSFPMFHFSLLYYL